MADHIIKDSSMYSDYESNSLLDSKDCAVRIGTIKESLYLDNLNEIKYIVEVIDNGLIVNIACDRSTSLGGLYNYEEYTLSGFNPGNSNSTNIAGLLPGDKVIVAYANGDAREGIIIGYMNHPRRKLAINDSNDSNPNENYEFLNKEGLSNTAYVSEFNGLRREINKIGEYKTTYKGTPKNVNKLLEPTEGKEMPLPEYDEDKGGSYYMFDENGSWELNDNNDQSIFVNKPDGIITITSGGTSLVIDKKEETYSITNKKTTFNSAKEFNVKSEKADFDVSKLFQVKTQNIKTSGKWSQNGDMNIIGKTNQVGDVNITGGFTTTGKTSLGGGGNPLIYDIILIMGTGNKGAPVISTATVLKTVQTKAS